MNTKKYLLAKSLYSRYGRLKNERYKQFGCQDRIYKTYCKIANFAANILHRNGLTSWL